MKRVKRVPLSQLGSFVLVVWLVLLAGCGGEPDVQTLITDANQDNIQRLANLYGGYQSRHGWVGPKDKDTFLEFIRGIHPSKLERMGVDPANIDGLFVSSRDNQQFKIRYGVTGGMGACVPVVFEEAGIDGQRRVGFTAMKSEEVDATRYDELWNGRGDTEAAGRDIQVPEGPAAP